jgi:putative ABC transport system substrate-binding protein
LGASAAAWPIVARARQASKLPLIGFLGATDAAPQRPWTAAFVQRLRELGWIEGRTVAIEYRWAEGRVGRASAIAAEFVRLKVDVIVTGRSQNVLAAEHATSEIPIVFAAAGDPVGNKLVASLARPGGNVTGLSLQQVETATKRLELLRQVTPGLRRLAIISNKAAPGAMSEMDDVQVAAKSLGFEQSIPFVVRQARDIFAAFDAFKSASADALYICTDPLLTTNRVRISTLAAAAHLASSSNIREYVEAGVLFSYGANIPNLYRRAAEYVDQVLRGAKPSVIPIEQPTKFDLVVNLTTARALDLIFPPDVLSIADEVIE